MKFVSLTASQGPRTLFLAHGLLVKSYSKKRRLEQRTSRSTLWTPQERGKRLMYSQLRMSRIFWLAETIRLMLLYVFIKSLSDLTKDIKNIVYRNKTQLQDTM